MADIANLKVGDTSYALKDSTARASASSALETANDAEAKADNALTASSTANSTANNALSIANTANTGQQNANKKIDGATLIGNYTENTQTLEILLKLGEVS